MTTDMIYLGRRAVACKGWRWMPGMAGTDALGVPFRCALTHHSGGMMVVAGMAFMPAYPDALARMFPDLTDPATLGCLLALAREAWGCQGFYVAQSNTRIKDTDILGWDFFGNLRGKSCKGMLYRSEAEALVAALEAAP